MGGILEENIVSHSREDSSKERYRVRPLKQRDTVLCTRTAQTRITGEKKIQRRQGRDRVAPLCFIAI